MRKLIVMMMLAVEMMATSVNIQAQETKVSKTEWIVTKIDDIKECYALFCTIYYNEDFKPERYSFCFRAQNDKYEVLEDRFVIFLGDAQGMYDTIKTCLDFSKTVRDNGLEFTTDGITMTNYKILWRWSTKIKINGEYHYFYEKDFNKLLSKFEKFCAENNIEYTAE